ncbi:MAG TPA: DUF4190 domain-containing protein [Thermobifida alba]|nr:DUF4190 domain-containing protein [Thermobifida alba]
MYDHWTEIVNPWTCASRFFRPDGADTTRPFQRLSDWRARIGAFFIIYLSIPATGWADLVWNFIGKGSLSLFVGAFVALTAVLLFWLGSTPPRTPAVRYYLGASVRRSAGSLLITFLLGLSVRAGLLPAVPFPLGWFLGWWVIIFALSMMWYALRWVFGVSDVHPLLGPVVSAATAVFAFTMETITVQPELPRDIHLLINVSGLVTVCLLAVCEFLFELGRRRRAAPYSPPPPLLREPARWNGLAVASLPVTVIACWPLGVVLAVLALRQIRQTGERGAGLARGSLVFTAVFLVGWCAFAIWYVMTYG